MVAKTTFVTIAACIVCFRCFVVSATLVFFTEENCATLLSHVTWKDPLNNFIVMSFSTALKNSSKTVV